MGVRALDIHHRHVWGICECQSGGWGTFADVSKHRLAYVPLAQVPAVGCPRSSQTHSRVLEPITAHLRSSSIVSLHQTLRAHVLFSGTTCVRAGWQHALATLAKVHVPGRKHTTTLHKQWGVMPEAGFTSACSTGGLRGCHNAPPVAPEALPASCLPASPHPHTTHSRHR